MVHPAANTFDDRVLLSIFVFIGLQPVLRRFDDNLQELPDRNSDPLVVLFARQILHERAKSLPT